MIKLPKSYMTCGVPLKIVRVEGCGGEFETDLNSGTIGLGREAQEADLVLAFMHEIAEASASEMGVRYTKTIGAKQYLFCCDHEQFSLWIQEVARGVYDLLQANRSK
ncbi:MAG: hypothetical protein C4542_08045 [Dehalococcoidia bacterium]|nr:MAG: hypothetical protein C4542_08045 [Dehalococcoidia bacterium]